MFFTKAYGKKSLIFILVVLLILIRNISINYPLPGENIAKVISISENYVIAKTKRSKVLIYTKENITYDSVIKYTGFYEEIFSPYSKYSFMFDKYAKNNYIKYSIKPKNLKVIKEGKTVRSYLYKKTLSHQDSKLLSKLLFKINNQDLDLDIIMLLSSAGVIIKSLISFLKKIFSKIMYPSQVFIVEIILYLFFMLIFKHYLFYLNILIFTFIKKLKYNKADSTFLSGTIILLIDPLYMYSLSFIINFSFRLLSCVSLNKNFRFIEGLIVILPIQLRLFYQANVFQILAYRFYKIIGTTAYLLAGFDLIFNSRFAYNFLKLVDFKPTYGSITGHMSTPLLVMWIFFSLLVLSRNKLVHKLSLIIILIINQNQLLFSPTLKYSQLYVGQGDGAILTYPHKREVLFIDTGPPSAKNKIEAFLNYYGVRKIHSIILSHDDLDHSGNKDYLIENYQVSKLVETPQVVDFYKLKLTTINFDLDDENDNSLITYFVINDYTYLSLGDISKDVEKMFLKEYSYIKPNIVKIGHHGSDTSSSDELLSLDSIKILLNSSGYRNMYKHPNHKVVKRVLKYQLPFIDTQQVGDIEIIHLFGYNFLAY